MSADFWLGVGVTAGTYAIFVLGLQINVGFTGLLNLGQAGFMGIGAYAMGMLVTDAGWSIWAAMPAAVMIAVGAGLLVGLPSPAATRASSVTTRSGATSPTGC